MSKKLTYEYVKEQIEKDGYELLSKEYQNSKTKSLVCCPENHKYSVKFTSFQQGHRCKICYSNSLKLNYKTIKKYIESFNHKILSEKYTGCMDKLRISGYNLISKEYINSRNKITIECDKRHKYMVKFYHFQNGSRCPECDKLKNSSKGEKEVLKYVKILTNEKIIENDRTQIINPKTGYNLELDIWIPSLNKAIEFNGEYWHSFNEVIKHDNIKKDQCKDKDINLLIIWDNNWIKNKHECLSEIKDFIND